MNFEVIEQRMKEEPFRPFRVFFIRGVHLDIKSPDTPVENPAKGVLRVADSKGTRTDFSLDDVVSIQDAH